MKRLKILTFVFVITTLVSCDAQTKQPNPGSDQPKDSPIVYLTSTDTTGQLMNEDEFWKIIDNSQATSGNNYQTQITSLKQILIGIDPKEIVKFDNTFTALVTGNKRCRISGIC